MTGTSSTNLERHFGTRHLTVDLKGRSVRGGAMIFASQFCKMLLTTGATVVLARLLSPKDFGLLAMVFAVNGFVEVFRDMGLSTATIQRPEINQQQVSSLFWLNTTIGVLIMLVVAALAPAIARFYHEPALVNITRALAIGFVLGGLNVQHRALLTRQMRFTELAIVDVVAGIVCGGVSIIAACMHQGYWALVYGQLALGVASTAGVWAVSRWRPDRPGGAEGVGSMLHFGANLAGYTSVNYLSRNLDNVVVGRFWGAAALGLYAKAYGLLLLPIQQITTPLTRVAIPALSRLQSEPARYRAYYRKAILMTAAFGMPLVVFLFVMANHIVPLVLGPEWVGSVRIFRVLAPAAFFGTFNVATGWVYMSLGQTDRQFRWGLLTSAVTILGFFAGVHWGPVGVAAAFSIVFCGLTMGPPSIIYCFRHSPLKPADLTGALWRPAVASIAAGAALFAAEHYLPDPGILWADCLVDAAFYLALYIACWACLPGGREFLGFTREMLRDLRPAAPRQSGHDGTALAIDPFPAAPVVAATVSAVTP